MSELLAEGPRRSIANAEVFHINDPTVATGLGFSNPSDSTDGLKAKRKGLPLKKVPQEQNFVSLRPYTEAMKKESKGKRKEDENPSFYNPLRPHELCVPHRSNVNVVVGEPIPTRPSFLTYFIEKLISFFRLLVNVLKKRPAQEPNDPCLPDPTSLSPRRPTASVSQ